MVENRDHIDEPDQSRISGSEEYEVRHFAEAIGLNVEKVRRLIQRHGEGWVTPASGGEQPSSH